MPPTHIEFQPERRAQLCIAPDENAVAVRFDATEVNQALGSHRHFPAVCAITLAHLSLSCKHTHSFFIKKDRFKIHTAVWITEHNDASAFLLSDRVAQSSKFVIDHVEQ